MGDAPITGGCPDLRSAADNPAGPDLLISYSLAAIRGLLAATPLARDCLD